MSSSVSALQIDAVCIKYGYLGFTCSRGVCYYSFPSVAAACAACAAFVALGMDARLFESAGVATATVQIFD